MYMVHVVSVCMWICIHSLTYVHMYTLYVLNTYYSYKYKHEYIDPLWSSKTHSPECVNQEYSEITDTEFYGRLYCM